MEYSTPTSSHSEPLELRETADMSNSCSEDIDETDTTKSLTSRPQQKDACYEDIDGVVHMEVFNEKYDLDTLTIEDPHEVITNTGANNCNYTYNKNERKDTTTTHNHTERKPDASQTTNGGNIRLNSESGTSVANQEKKREDGDDIRIHQKSRHRSASRSPRQSEPLSNPRDRDIRTNDTKRDSVTLNQRESAFHSNKTETSKITHIDTYRPSYSCRNERLNSHNRSRSPQRDLRYNFRPRSRSPQPDRHIDRDRNGGSFNNHSSTFRSSNRDHGRPGYQGIYYDPTRDSKMSPTTSVDTYFVPNSNSAQLPPRTITSTTTTPGAQSQDRMPLARLLQDLSHNNNNNTPHSNAPPPSQLELQQQQQAHQQLQFQLQQLLGGQQIHLQPQYNHHYHHQHQQQQQQDILSLSPPLSTSAQYTTPVMNNLAALAQVFQFQGQEYQLIPVNPNNNKRSRDMEDNDVEEKDRESKRSKK